MAGDIHLPVACFLRRTLLSPCSEPFHAAYQLTLVGAEPGKVQNVENRIHKKEYDPEPPHARVAIDLPEQPTPRLAAENVRVGAFALVSGLDILAAV